MRRGIIFWLTFIIAILLAIYLSVRIVIYSRAVRIGDMSATVTGGHISAATLRDNIGLRRGAVINPGDIENIVARLAGLPEIDAAAVRRMPNGDIRVMVRAVKTVALWTNGADCFPLADNGNILSKRLPSCPDGEFVFSGPIPARAPEFLTELRKHQNIFKNISRVNWTDGRRWDLITRDNIIIKLPEYDVVRALEKLSSADRQWNMLDRRLAGIDLRDDDRILGITN